MGIMVIFLLPPWGGLSVGSSITFSLFPEVSLPARQTVAVFWISLLSGLFFLLSMDMASLCVKVWGFIFRFRKNLEATIYY